MPQRNRRQDSMVLHNNHINHQLHVNLVTSGVPRYPTSTLESVDSSTTGPNMFPLRTFGHYDADEIPDYENFDVHDLEAGNDPDPPPGALNRDISMSSTSIANTGLEKKKLNTDCVRVFKVLFIFSLFAAILISATLSKITFFAIASKLYDSVVNASNYTGTTRNDPTYQSVAFAQIVIILMAPQLITVVRMFFAGYVGKSDKNYPWPSFKAFIGGVFVSTLEAFALTAFAFLVATHLDPDKSILLTSGIFIFTSFLGMCCCCCSDRQPPQRRERASQGNRFMAKFAGCCEKFMNTPLVNFVAFVLQVGGLVGAAFLIFFTNEQNFEQWLQLDYLSTPGSYLLRVTLTVLVVGPLLSVIWSRLVQGLIFKFNFDPLHPNLGFLEGRPGLPASRRGGFLYAGVRFVVIPIAAYGFMGVLQLEPNFTLAFKWSGLDIATVLVQILASLLTIILCLISLWTTMQKWAFTLPLLLSTPAAVAWYWLSQIPGSYVFPFQGDYAFSSTETTNHYVLAVLALLWLGQILALGGYIWKRPKYALAREQSLFLSPYYDPIFLDSFLLLNRHSIQTSHWFANSNFKSASGGVKKRPAVFICSTMYREAEHEMKQMLTSIRRVAEAIKDARRKYSHHEKRAPAYESHIFFDGATVGNKFNEFVLQLISLLEESLGLTLADLEKTATPYGYQLKWTVNDTLPFFIHLKDNTKVKNKKRWSQVMYMSYILNYRLQERDEQGRELFDPHSTYILTTDADIEFKADSVAALLDFLARDDSVGAVCARTHPLGSGPLVWYQIFEYAFGHWFQKSAEHVLGCVLCCPGCFSVFRVSAIAEVLETYQSSVTSAAEFLTKDMGEDRWLCTLLIQKGWRLEYAALAENSTYCPESFDEFFNQRRRWVPSTVANLMELLANASSIARNNDSISFLFIIYQLVIIFSTAITPSTVILVVASGLQSAYEWDTNVVVGILSAISVIYGLVCLIFPEKTQLNVAKALTLASAIIMAIAFTGIVTDTISFIEDLAALPPNSTLADSPVNIDSIYLWGFSLIVLIAGVLHFTEFTALLHFIWYILGLPAAYLLLLIYSAANLNNRSWGTRVGISAKKNVEEDKLTRFKVKVAALFVGMQAFLKSCARRGGAQTDAEAAKGQGGNEEPPVASPKVEEKDGRPTSPLKLRHAPMQEDVKQWLRRLQCEEFIPNFEEHGYTRFDFIWGMNIDDLQAIGIDKRGYVLRLAKAIKKQVPPLFQSRLPSDISDFLECVHLEEYLPVLKAEGYSMAEDVENMIGLGKEDLRKIGVTKRAHVNTMAAALIRLRNPTCREIKIHNTKSVVENAPTFQMGRSDLPQERFWLRMTEGALKPEVVYANSDTDELKGKLRALRNNTLIAMLIVNVMWMALLLSFNLQYFEAIGISQSALPVIFAVLYFGIILIQFLCLLAHRIETFVHIIARTNI